jgi:hypothetical protein
MSSGCFNKRTTASRISAAVGTHHSIAQHDYVEEFGN